MRIVPAVDALSAPFWQAARDHRLAVQACEDCGALQHPPAPLCRSCHGGRLAFRPVSGRGTLYAFTVVHHSVHPATVDKVPYVLALVQLDEGPRLAADVVDCPFDDLAVGMALDAVYDDVSDGVALVQFRPA